MLGALIMNLSNQTRTLLLENMDNELDHETVWLARDILAAITDKRDNPKKAIDAGVVKILSKAVWDYETKQKREKARQAFLNQKALTGFNFEGGI
jgi:hypothetical protein